MSGGVCVLAGPQFAGEARTRLVVQSVYINSPLRVVPSSPRTPLESVSISGGCDMGGDRGAHEP